jgi:hypothetical protein
MSKFDKDLKVGDVIVAYHKGYHRITKIERRFITKQEAETGYARENGLKEGDEYSSLIHYDAIIDSKGNMLSGKKKNNCDAEFCSLALTDVVEQIKILKNIQNKLSSI